MRTNDDIESAIRRISDRAVKLGVQMTREFFDAARVDGEPSALTVQRRLNMGWTDVVSLVGAPAATVDIDVGFDEVSRIYGELGKEPSRAEYDDNRLDGSPSSITLMRLCNNSWRSVVAVALYSEDIT